MSKCYWSNSSHDWKAPQHHNMFTRFAPAIALILVQQDLHTNKFSLFSHMLVLAVVNRFFFMVLIASIQRFLKQHGSGDGTMHGGSICYIRTSSLLTIINSRYQHRPWQTPPQSRYNRSTQSIVLALLQKLWYLTRSPLGTNMNLIFQLGCLCSHIKWIFAITASQIWHWQMTIVMSIQLTDNSQDILGNSLS